jgi:peptidoglycan/LPS O-acetylase OafA/YrhL
MVELPGERQYIASLTGLRGIAALLVFLYHYEVLHPGIRLDLAIPWIGKILQFPLGFGFAGVDIFFVLSGFLLSLPFALAATRNQASPPLKSYFKRRFLRVFPAYYAQLFLILVIGGWFVIWEPLSAYAFTAHLLMFFNIGWEPVRPLVGVWWTLPVEMGFYLLLPLLAPYLSHRKWLPVLLAGIAISLAYRAWAGTHFAEQGSAAAFLAASQLPGNLAEFLLGASAALLVQWNALQGRPRPAGWILNLMFVLGLLVPATWLWNVVLSAGADYWLGHWSMIVAPLVIGLPLSVSVLGLYWGSRFGALLLANRAVYFLGLISYSLYLWHFVVMQQLQMIIGEHYADLPHWLTFPLATVSVVLAASLSYYLVERPFYKLRNFRQLKER